MMVQDGVFPSNKGQGYVLRRLIRRALVHSQLAEESTEWIAKVVAAVSEIYADAYPEIAKNQEQIAKVIQEEADRFKRSLSKGLKEIGKLDNLTAKAAFDLYQNYGFPWELSREYAISKGIGIEEADFEAEFEKHKNLSRSASAGQFASGLADHSEKTVQYHTATHLLHQALRTILGDQVQQKGSNITPERLRFDFSYPEKMTTEQISQVENLVNEQIGRKLEVTSVTMSPDQAAGEGAIGLFGHKYGESVSVYTMGDFSKEICTGPHVKNTGELGHFRIAKEEAVSAGVRRIKAVIE
jgi:alanyl-tRNA synthetase